MFQRGYFISPVISWQPSENFRWKLEAEFRYQDLLRDDGLFSPDGTFEGATQFPNTFFFGNGNQEDEKTGTRTVLLSTIDYQINDSWRLRNIVSFEDFAREVNTVYANELLGDGRTIERFQYDFEDGAKNYFTQLDLLGELATGDITALSLIN